jgi:Tfp pilus assembly protein PilF
MTGCPRAPAVLGRLAVLLILATVAAGCAPKRAPAAAPVGTNFPEFVFPAPPEALASQAAAARHQLGWQWLQAGDLRAAERHFNQTLQQSSGFYPARAGLGYVALARKEPRDAVAHFDRALTADRAYAPALAGRGEALLALGQREQALASFEAALASDASLSAVRGRVQVLRFRGLQDDVAQARRAAEAGRLAEARSLYQRSLAASPESPFLYRELAAVEQREGNLTAALEHAQKAVTLDPNDPRSHITLADVYEAQSEFVKAAGALTAAAALEPSEALDIRIESLRERAAFAAMPLEYRSIETSPTVTRAQLAALFGVRLDDLLRRARRRSSVVMTDTRGNWAAPWIIAVTRAGVMEAFPNHTFQPNAVVRRGDLAVAASRALSLIAAEKPKLGAPWRNARRKFPDISPGHLHHPAASLAVEAGVMATLPDGSFQLSRPVTGADAVAAVRKLEELSETRAR